MRYLSVCSGIEAATVAWHPLGWEPVAFSEIEAFPSAVLAHHYPTVPNWGDMTRFQEWPDAAFDVLVGGTPCQSFSVAGLRRGMADPRGNLALVYLALADRYRPEWLVWENVPGVLSSAGGRDFGAFLGALVELGYGFAYRVLDAQHFGLAQRRQRVFVVANLGGWQRAAAVLFEPASLRGDSAPRREAGEGVAASLSAGSNPSSNAAGRRREDDVNIVHTLRAEGVDASEDGSGRGIPLTVGALTDGAHNGGGSTDRMPTVAELSLCLNAGGMGRNDAETETLIPTNGGGFDVTAFHNRQDPDVSGNVTHPLGRQDNGMGVHMQTGVRRLTPVECSRLQGFPGDYLELRYADADEAHAAQVLHELWKEAGTPAVEKQGWRTGISAALLTPEVLLAGVYVGWLSWEMAARCASARGSLQGEVYNQEGFVCALRRNGEARRTPFGRESFEQCARELGSHLSLLPLEGAQARAFLRSSELWPKAQATWPLRYALAKGKARENPDRMNPDDPRYKALGNSMAVPVMRWIGARINQEDV